MDKIGVVVIGRNEGDRLIRSLESIVNGSRPVVYVDSGSTDGSCEAARKRGVEVVDLDLSIPFTAARARNAGFEQMCEKYPEVEYVQFIDGDCEVVKGWLEAAAQTLDAHPEVVAVCGWRRERYPENSVYNRICDVEWRIGSPGTILSFAGDVMIRREPLAAVGGYNNRMIAFEEGELCVRLRRTGGILLRIDKNCTLHDADMHSAKQWWKRAKRCGYGLAQISYVYGNATEPHFVKSILRIWLWGIIMPIVALGLAIPTYGLSLLGLGRYPVAILREISRKQKAGYSKAESVAWGVSAPMAAIPEAFGLIQFNLDRLGKKQHKIIEYK
ncbi:MAG: glycosyltransferase family A protein [Microcoleaceae cyanobacterium MO_207.B10]|nr:glycosyltransferase family A protein [Microcoleaceae cyanobacterium MO_207.B10]